jgi:hypothetical protein
MYNKPGFLLMEFSVYFFLLVLLATFIGSFMVTAQRTGKKQRAEHYALLNSWFAADRFVTDIRQAPMSEKEWKKMDQDCLVWRHKANEIGWVVEDSVLYRVEGTWHDATQSWGKHTKNLVAQKIKTCVMQVRRDLAGQKIKGCEIRICFEGGNREENIYRFAAVRGG